MGMANIVNQYGIADAAAAYARTSEYSHWNRTEEGFAETVETAAEAVDTIVNIIKSL